MLNKLRCHAPFLFEANQITWSRLFIHIHILNCKQCRFRSVGFWRSQLIWIYTIFKGRVYPSSAGLELRYCWISGKQCRPWCNATFYGVWSGSAQFINDPAVFMYINKGEQSKVPLSDIAKIRNLFAREGVETFQSAVQSSLVILKSEELSEELQDIHTSTY